MEFYINVMDIFLSPRDKILSIFAGGKAICAAWVSDQHCLLDFILI
jgi:hypothetical protein